MNKNKEENTSPVINEDVMMERGKFVANGYMFHVKPIFLGEEDEYLSEMTVSPVLTNNENQPTDKELGTWAIALFSSTVNKPEKKHNKVIAFFKNLFCKKNYRYYDDYPAVQPLIKWLERKVTYKGRKIRFYDLERKFGLNKTEIEKLFIYFHEISGF